jgi:hypothetical protein
MSLATSVGFDDGEGATFGVKTEEPPTFVRKMMVSAAERQKIADVGATAISPIADMVRCAVFEGDAAAADGTGLVHHPKRSPLMWCGQSL